MSTIRVRRLDTNWDPVWGNGQNDYVFDVYALIQIIQSRLRLWLAEWWMNQEDGLPMIQKILGQRVKDKELIDRLIQKRIAGTVYVKSITAFSSSFDSNTRAYSCQSTVDTQFGTIVVQGGG
jgi:hypothetical protein